MVTIYIYIKKKRSKSPYQSCRVRGNAFQSYFQKYLACATTVTTILFTTSYVLQSIKVEVALIGCNLGGKSASLAWIQRHSILRDSPTFSGLG